MVQQQIPPDAPSPRLCAIIKETPDQEYGYNLHAEKGKGQFIGAVDPNSAADRAGLKPGDRIFAVNGVPISGDSHKQVVQRIKQNPMQCELLVMTEDGAKWYQEHGIQITPSLPNVIHPGRMVNGSSQSPPPAAGWYAPGSAKNDHTPEVIVTGVHGNQSSPMSSSSSPNTRPRLCRLIKVNVTDEFGFNLHAEKGRGHFIGTVDKEGIGDRAGLIMGQRIVGVNGTLVYPNTPHKDVVSLIKTDPMLTTLLVASEEVDQWHRDNGGTYSFEKCDPYIVDGGHGTMGNTDANHHVPPYTAYHDDGISVSSSSAGSEHLHLRIQSSSQRNRHRSPSEPMDNLPTIVATAIEDNHRDPIERHIETMEKAAHEVEPRRMSLFKVGDEEEQQHHVLHKDDDLLEQVFAGVPSMQGKSSTSEGQKHQPIQSYHLHDDEEGDEPLHRHHEMQHESLTVSESSHRPAPTSPPESSIPFQSGVIPSSTYDRRSPSPVVSAIAPAVAPIVHHQNYNGGGVGALTTANGGVMSSGTALGNDIFQLSAKDARERLRHKKKDPRNDKVMSLEEKYRVVSNM